VSSTTVHSQTNKCLLVQQTAKGSGGLAESAKMLKIHLFEPTMGSRANSLSSQRPQWIPDSETDECMNCGNRFSTCFRRHHCRRCGLVVCSGCSGNKRALPEEGYPKPVRVCDPCFADEILKAEREKSSIPRVPTKAEFQK